jgi:hypothetical protein
MSASSANVVVFDSDASVTPLMQGCDHRWLAFDRLVAGLLSHAHPENRCWQAGQGHRARQLSIQAHHG